MGILFPITADAQLQFAVHFARWNRPIPFLNESTRPSPEARTQL